MLEQNAAIAYADTNKLYSPGEMAKVFMNISPKGMIIIESTMLVAWINARTYKINVLLN